jgi:hypothetical protein
VTSTSSRPALRLAAAAGVDLAAAIDAFLSQPDLAGDVEVLDLEAQDLVGAGGGLVEQPPQGAFAQVDVAALPQPLEARERDAAGVVVLLGAALQIDVAVDLEDPGARAVVRERSDGRDVAVPRRRRRVMPALLDDAGEAGAGDRRVAELVFDDGERLAVLRARRSPSSSLWDPSRAVARRPPADAPRRDLRALAPVLRVLRGGVVIRRIKPLAQPTALNTSASVFAG